MTKELALLVLGALVLASLLTHAYFVYSNTQKVAHVAEDLAEKTEETAKHVNTQLEDIHMLVNSRLDEALDRIALLERRLGLAPGQDPNTKEKL